MLYLLTGEVQTGKTRWLEALIARLAESGVAAYGVLAPGVWVPAEPSGFEKLGIDNVLLPEGRRIPFARREDLAHIEGGFDPESQAAKAHLKWHISDSAIAEVNQHLASIPARIDEMRARALDGCNGASVLPCRQGSGCDSRNGEGVSAGEVADKSAGKRVSRGIIVIDELGPLELRRGQGIMRGVELLERGPMPGVQNAILIVRSSLADMADERFSEVWGGSVRILPDDAGAAAVFLGVGLSL